MHTDLNPCGGAEQVALATIQALIGMGIDVELLLARRPNLSRLKHAFGNKRVNAIFRQIKRIDLFDGLPLKAENHDYGRISDDVITINTHGDMLPYYLPYFSRINTITYCHYPLAVELIEQGDISYANYLMDLGLAKFDAKRQTSSLGSILDNGDQVWRRIHDNYIMLLKCSTVITNSAFSRDAIQRVLSKSPSTKAACSSSGELPSKTLVIPPPVSVEEFRRAALYSCEREDFVVVISRFNPSKKLENAIALAHLLKKRNIGKGMIIVGGLMPQDRQYYDQIVNMIKSSGVSDYVRLEINATSEMLLSLLRKGKAYFHPMQGEPFGISIAEAMSAGLIPIVLSIGGHADFVPEKYRFSSLGDAAEKISLALNASQRERKVVSDIVTPFSQINYIKSIQKVMRSLIEKSRMSLEPSAKVSKIYKPAAA